MDSLLPSSDWLIGKIPPEIGNCSMLKHHSFKYNFLSCSIPRELCNSESLVETDLDENLLSKTIEDVIFRCTNLTQLVLVIPFPRFCLSDSLLHGTVDLAQLQ